MVRLLRGHDVDFILIGGFSLAFHGHSRGTDDVDIVPDPAPANLERLWAALQELHAEPVDLSEFRPDEVPPFDLESLIAGGSWFMQTDFGKLDVLQTLDGVPVSEQPWNVLRARAQEAELDEVGVPFLVAGRDDLIMLKRATGRAQDLIDVESLRLAEGRDE
jgi:hypothetical protein